MATLETLVSSPLGGIMRLHGRVPKEDAVAQVRKFLNDEILRAEAHLRELDNWTVTANRGSTKALTYEEAIEKGVRP